MCNTKIIFCFFIVLLSLSLKAQRQSDVLVMGNSVYSIPAEAPGSNFLMVFNEDSLEYIDNETPIILSNFFSRASYSDKHGNLKFASNGWRLVNSFGEVLSYKLWREDMEWPQGSPDTTLVDISKGPLFLEDPADSNRVYLFYGQYKRDIPSSIGLISQDVYFTYAILDVPSQSMISINHTVLSDTTSISDAVAVRHGNGRDWWIIKPGIFSNEYYIGLLDINGVSSMQHVFIEGLEPHTQTYTTSHFSQDGNHFIHFSGFGPKWVQRMDFDRCTGILSNPQDLDISSLFRPADLPNFIPSPDLSKFYGKRLNYNDSSYQYGTYQYDFVNDSLTFITLATGLSFISPNYNNVFNFELFDNSNPFENMYYSTINNLTGNGLEYQQFRYELTNTATCVLAPNIVNYRLGSLVGSACDPLALEDMALIKSKKLSLELFPNPANTQLHVRINDPQNDYSIRLYNSIGELVYSTQLSKGLLDIDLTSLSLSSGVYFIELSNSTVIKREKILIAN